MFGFSKSVSYQDSQLGALEHRKGKWRGKITLPAQGEKLLALSGNRNQPDAESIALAHQLPSQYTALVPAIQNALFAHYEPYGEEAGEDAQISPVKNDASLWGYVKLIGVLIEPLAGTPTVEIAYQVDWDDEHTLGARIQNGKLLELNGSILSVF